VAYGYAARRGWDVDSALVDLHQNNMDRCVWPDGTIHRREDGKILKNPNHTKIDLQKYV
jgi:predicted HAD superfamily Cof-like phosphohydrolase